MILREYLSQGTVAELIVSMLRDFTRIWVPDE